MVWEYNHIHDNTHISTHNAVGIRTYHDFTQVAKHI